MPDAPDVVAFAPAEGGVLAERIGPAESAHPGQSGFRLLSDGTEAFVVRMQSARSATRSLDVQTYIWHADTTGAYLGQVLLDSADRGVRVRLLVDDLDARAKNDGFAALAAHPNVEVRMFNPWVTRKGTLAQAGEGALSFKRINRRMHNKSWIADNRIAVVGGRNVGDEYFGAGEDMNFVDLDFAMMGPIVRDVSATFDRYWNSESAYPMETLDPEAVTDAALERLRSGLEKRAGEAKESRYATALAGSDLVSQMIAGEWPVAVVFEVPVHRGRPGQGHDEEAGRQAHARGRRVGADDRRRARAGRGHLAVLRAGRGGDGGIHAHGRQPASRSASSPIHWSRTTSLRSTAATRAIASRCSRAASSSGS